MSNFISNVFSLSIVNALFLLNTAVLGIFTSLSLLLFIIFASKYIPLYREFSTFFTAANFLGYGNKLFVSRAIPADALNATVLQNQSTVANNSVATQTDLIKNREHHDGLTLSSTASLAAFIAKYPGELGNSLKVSVCDSALAFEDTFTGITNSSMDVNGSNNGVTATMAVGSNTLILSQSGSCLLYTSPSPRDRG